MTLNGAYLRGAARFLFSLTASICIVVCAVTKDARAETGIRCLDEAAISVKAPDKVVLIAVTRAGNRLIAVGEHGVICYSDDNGVTWLQAKVPVDVTLTSVAFVSPVDGWAAGHYGVILHTTDAGATWEVSLNGIEANQLTLAAAQQAMSLSNGSDVAKRALRRANFFVDDGPDKPFLSIWAPNPNDVMVFGSYRMFVRTTDEGKTWVDLSLNVGDPLSHNLYDAVGANGNIFVVGETGLVFRSTDGGKSFPEVTSPTQATLFGGVAAGNRFLVFGVAGEVYQTTDAGKTWSPISFGTAGNLTSGLVLNNATIIVGSEDGSLYVSHDQGNTFTVFPNVLPNSIYGLAQAPNGDVITVGSLGVVRVPIKDFN
jgi:photosystem II stability/assembly factor-like uncharacterized protein